MHKDKAIAKATIQAAEIVFDLPNKSIEGPQRHREFAWPRFIAIKVMRDTTELSLPSIGRIVNRDHTTVMSAVKRAEELMRSDVTMANAYRDVRERAEDLTGVMFTRNHIPVFRSVRGK